MGHDRRIEIHDGRGFGRISRKIGPMRLKIAKYACQEGLYWVLVKGKDNNDGNPSLEPMLGLDHSSKCALQPNPFSLFVSQLPKGG